MVFVAEEHLSIPNTDLISWIFDNPRYDQHKEVYLDAANPARSISYRQARRIVRQLAAGFQAAGLKKGDCVCLHSFNDIYYSIIVLGVIAAGGVFTGTNPAYTQHELQHTIKTAEVTWLISEPELLGTLLEAAKVHQIPNSHVWVFNPLPTQKVPSALRSWTELLQHGEVDWVRFDNVATSKSTIAMRLFSSGTTGLPKAVNVSHFNFIAQHELVWAPHVAKVEFEDVHLFPLPMFHAAIAFRAHTSTLKEGQRSYIMRRFDLAQYLTFIEKYGITNIAVVPPIAIAILMSPLSKHSLRGLRWCLSGAAPLRPETQARLQSLMREDCPLTQHYGMTESSCSAFTLPFPEKDATGSVGRPIPNLDVKLVDDDGKDLGKVYGVSGEMCIKGPTIVPGYHKNAKATAESFDKDGFYHTGDIMYCDEATKKWYIVDRKKELIKVRSFQVAPPEIEAILLDHPAIVDCAVVGVKHDEAGQEPTELPRAYVVRRPSIQEQDLTETMVKDYVKPKLAKYKWLEGGVEFVEVIPKSANGKILKRVLRDQIKKESRAQSGTKL